MKKKSMIQIYMKKIEKLIIKEKMQIIAPELKKGMFYLEFWNNTRKLNKNTVYTRKSYMPFHS